MRRMWLAAGVLLVAGCVPSGRSAADDQACQLVESHVVSEAVATGEVTGTVNYPSYVRGVRVVIPGTGGDVRAALLRLAAAYEAGRQRPAIAAQVHFRAVCGFPLDP